MKTVEILGVNFAKIDLQKTIRKIKHWVEKGGRYQLMTLNPEYLVRIEEDQLLKGVVERADLVVADASGIILASWLIYIRSRIGRQRLSFKERITGGELVEALARLAVQEGWKIGLIGGGPGIADKALAQLRTLTKEVANSSTSEECSAHHPRCSFGDSNLKGFADRGPVNVKRQTKEEWRRIKQLLLKERPQILFTSFGFHGPVWIEKTLKALQSRGKSLIAIEVGGVFNYLAGITPQPPKILRKVGLEWLWRLVTEPWRWRRQLDLIKFICLVMKGSG